MRSVKIKKTLKWTLYSLFALLLFCFQNAPVKLPVLSSVLFFIPAVVAVSCFEKMIPSAVFSLVCGMFWDYSAQKGFGYNTLVMLLVSFFVSLVIMFFVKPIFQSTVVALCIASVTYNVVDFFFFILLQGYENPFNTFLNRFLPSIFSTALVGILILYVYQLIYFINPSKADFETN